MTPVPAHLQYPSLTREQFMAPLEVAFDPIELDNVATAYAFAKYAHRGQNRESGVRYFEHPRAVAWIIIDELKLVDWQLVVLALMHDVMEDTHMLSWHRLRLNFGTDITVGVDLLTKRRGQDHSDYINRFSEATWQVLLVKLVDRLHNLRTMDVCSAEKTERKVAETRRHYVPLVDALAERLPTEYRWIAHQLRDLITERCDALIAA